MMKCMIKTGASSIVLGTDHYKQYFPKQNKLLKISKQNEKHHEMRCMSVIRKIKDAEKYYSLPDEEAHIIKPTEKFYKHVEQLVRKDDMDIFGEPLQWRFVDYAGDNDMLDALNYLGRVGYSLFWNSWNDVMRFNERLLVAVEYLHENRICHLDIKPENIVMNSRNREFKLIDFGFSSKYPFDDFVCNIRGTPGYFPKQFKCAKPSNQLPSIIANDMITDADNEYPMMKRRDLVYLIDSFCLGRVIYSLYYIFNDNYFPLGCCLCWNKQKQKKILRLVDDLLNADVYQRLTVYQCVKKHFPKTIL